MNMTDYQNLDLYPYCQNSDTEHELMSCDLTGTSTFEKCELSKTPNADSSSNNNISEQRLDVNLPTSNDDDNLCVGNCLHEINAHILDYPAMDEAERDEYYDDYSYDKSLEFNSDIENKSVTSSDSNKDVLEQDESFQISDIHETRKKSHAVEMFDNAFDSSTGFSVFDHNLSNSALKVSVSQTVCDIVKTVNECISTENVNSDFCKATTEICRYPEQESMGINVAITESNATSACTSSCSYNAQCNPEIQSCSNHIGAANDLVSVSDFKVPTEVTVTSATLPENISTPSQDKSAPTYNPFESALSDRLHLPMCSPGIFSQKSNSVQKESFWSVEHIAELNPVDIDETAHRSPYTLLKDKDAEVKRQQAIKQFFSTHLIAPSPYQSNAPVKLPATPASVADLGRENHEVSSTLHYELAQKPRVTNDASCQTVLTIPVVFDIQKLLGDFMTHHGDDDPEQLSNSSLRRKLFFNGDTSCLPSPSPVKNTPDSRISRSKLTSPPSFSPLSQPNFSSSPFRSSFSPNPTRTSQGTDHIMSPDLSPVKSVQGLDGQSKIHQHESFVDSPGPEDRYCHGDTNVTCHHCVNFVNSCEKSVSQVTKQKLLNKSREMANEFFLPNSQHESFLPLASYQNFSPGGMSTPDKRREKSRFSSSSGTPTHYVPLPCRHHSHNSTQTPVSDQSRNLTSMSLNMNNKQEGQESLTRDSAAIFDFSSRTADLSDTYGQLSHQDTGYQTQSLQQTNLYPTSASTSSVDAEHAFARYSKLISSPIANNTQDLSAEYQGIKTLPVLKCEVSAGVKDSANLLKPGWVPAISYDGAAEFIEPLKSECKDYKRSCNMECHKNVKETPPVNTAILKVEDEILKRARAVLKSCPNPQEPVEEFQLKNALPSSYFVSAVLQTALQDVQNIETLYTPTLADNN